MVCSIAVCACAGVRSCCARTGLVDIVDVVDVVDVVHRATDSPQTVIVDLVILFTAGGSSP